METGMIKPVYIRNSDIFIGNNPVTDYEILESVNKCGLWRIYVNILKAEPNYFLKVSTSETQVSLPLKPTLFQQVQALP